MLSRVIESKSARLQPLTSSIVLQNASSEQRQAIICLIRNFDPKLRVEVFPGNQLLNLALSEDDPAEFIRDFGARLTMLTKKERIVLECVMKGDTNKVISFQLGLTSRTIELRKASLMRKLGVHTHTALVRDTTRYETLQQYVHFSLDTGSSREPELHATPPDMKP